MKDTEQGEGVCVCVVKTFFVCVRENERVAGIDRTTLCVFDG